MEARKLGIVGGSQLENELPATIAAPQTLHAFPLGPNVKWTFAVLWSMAGGKPGTVKTSCAAIAAALNRDETRSTRRDINTLKAVGLVDGPRDAAGLLTLYVADPTDVAVARRIVDDPQRRLIDDDPPEVTGGADNQAPESPAPHTHTMAHGVNNSTPSTYGMGADNQAPESPPVADDVARLQRTIDQRRREAAAAEPRPVVPPAYRRFSPEAFAHMLARLLDAERNGIARQYLLNIATAVERGEMDHDRVDVIARELVDDVKFGRGDRIGNVGQVFTHRLKKAYPSQPWKSKAR
jgi:hypothetical protein